MSSLTESTRTWITAEFYTSNPMFNQQRTFGAWWATENKQVVTFSLPPSFVIAVIHLFVCLFVCFNPEPVESYCLGGKVMEEEKRHANVAPTCKVLAIISCDEIKEISGYLKAIYRQTHSYLPGEKWLRLQLPDSSLSALNLINGAYCLVLTCIKLGCNEIWYWQWPFYFSRPVQRTTPVWKEIYLDWIPF